MNPAPDAVHRWCGPPSDRRRRDPGAMPWQRFRRGPFEFFAASFFLELAAVAGTRNDAQLGFPCGQATEMSAHSAQRKKAFLRMNDVDAGINIERDRIHGKALGLAGIDDRARARIAHSARETDRRKLWSRRLRYPGSRARASQKTDAGRRVPGQRFFSFLSSALVILRQLLHCREPDRSLNEIKPVGSAGTRL